MNNEYAGYSVLVLKLKLRFMENKCSKTLWGLSNFVKRG